MTKFEVGKTHATCSICNSDCWFSYKVIKRTKCTVTLFDESYGIEKRRKIQEYNGSEFVYPEGKYSMCPTLNAERDENRKERETQREAQADLPDNVISIDAWKSHKAV